MFYNTLKTAVCMIIQRFQVELLQIMGMHCTENSRRHEDQHFQQVSNTYHFSKAANWLSSSCQAYTRCSWVVSNVRMTPCGSRLRVPRAFSAAPMSLTAPSGSGECRSMRSWSPVTLTVVGAQSMPAAASKKQQQTLEHSYKKGVHPRILSMGI